MSVRTGGRVSGRVSEIPNRRAEGKGIVSVPSVRALWIGVRAAARTPRVVRGPSLAALLAEPARATTRGDTSIARQSDEATTEASRRTPEAPTFALALLARLSRLPGGYWLDTCLFRAVAECLALRAEGLPAVVRIGVAGTAIPSEATARRRGDRRAGASGAERARVAAHAWAECPGVRCLTAVGSERATYSPLEPVA